MPTPLEAAIAAAESKEEARPETPEHRRYREACECADTFPGWRPDQEFDPASSTPAPSRKRPQRKEEGVERQIEEKLREAGYIVWHTTPRRTKGPSGVTPGLGDLVISHDEWPEASALILEVKLPGYTKSDVRPAQREMKARRRLIIVTSWEEALTEARAFGRRHSA